MKLVYFKTMYLINSTIVHIQLLKIFMVCVNTTWSLQRDIVANNAANLCFLTFRYYHQRRFRGSHFETIYMSITLYIYIFRNLNGNMIFLYCSFNGYSSFYFVATVFYGYSDSFTVKVYCSEHQNLYGFTLEPLNYKLYTCGLFLLWPKYIPYEKITIYFWYANTNPCHWGC